MTVIRLLAVTMLGLLAFALLTGCSGTDAAAPAASEVAMDTASPGRLPRIVVFKDGAGTPTARQAIIRGAGGDPGVDLRLIKGMAAGLTPAAENALKRNPNVLRVDPDVVVQAIGEIGTAAKPAPKPKPPPPTPPGPAQVLPWGVDRIDAEAAHAAGYKGAGTRVAILDSGIQKDHPDLRVVAGVNYVSSPIWKPARASNWADDNGHGTHVAGTVAALDNTIGVIGVAPAASLYAVKVLDSTGSGYLSWIISGLNWCVTNHIGVLNMSFGTTDNVQALQDACDAASAAGVKLVAASGNSGSAVLYPAAYDSVIAVGALTNADQRAWFSCYGAQLDIAAPGVDILSTTIGSAYMQMSGTSMATPHVTGAIALRLSGNLYGTADDLSPAGLDIYTGYGRVDAEELSAGTEDGNHPPPSG